MPLNTSITVLRSGKIEVYRGVEPVEAIMQEAGLRG